MFETNITAWKVSQEHPGVQRKTPWTYQTFLQRIYWYEILMGLMYKRGGGRKRMRRRERKMINVQMILIKKLSEPEIFKKV